MATRLLVSKLADKTALSRLRGAVQGKNLSTSAVATQGGNQDRYGDRAGFQAPRRRRRSPMLRRWSDLTPFGFSDLWEPFPMNRTLTQMMDTVNRLFEEFVPSRTLGQEVENFRAAYDVVEDENSYKLRFDMPGLSKEEVKVAIENGTLVIKGEHSEEEKEKNWSARSFGSYNSRIVLPDNVRLDGIKAEMKNGVLQLFLPKMEEENKAATVVDVKVE
uniref:TSA: Wollemia nobilis Ref_Wollemi_Transcript_20205_992 transcribed RNA sequence n=1 Tax=Wollemia nobilis TaxID=56998 RepID=A0A0C9S596_9CONI